MFYYAQGGQHSVILYVCGWLENENGENNVFGIFGNDFEIICYTQDRVKYFYNKKLLDIIFI